MWDVSQLHVGACDRMWVTENIGPCMFRCRAYHALTRPCCGNINHQDSHIGGCVVLGAPMLMLLLCMARAQTVVLATTRVLLRHAVV